MVSDKEGDRVVNHQRYTLEPLPTKVENFIQRLDREMQERINVAFEYIRSSPFQHENPTTIKNYVERRKGFIATESDLSVSFTALTEANG